MRIPAEHKTTMEEGRLLYRSSFPDKLRRATVETALFRNRFVAALAERIVVPYAAFSSRGGEPCIRVQMRQMALF